MMDPFLTHPIIFGAIFGAALAAMILLKRRAEERKQYLCLSCELVQSGIRAKRPPMTIFLFPLNLLWAPKMTCRGCRSHDLIPVDSPRAQRILAAAAGHRHRPDGTAEGREEHGNQTDNRSQLVATVQVADDFTEARPFEAGATESPESVASSSVVPEAAPEAKPPTPIAVPSSALSAVGRKWNKTAVILVAGVLVFLFIVWISNSGSSGSESSTSQNPPSSAMDKPPGEEAFGSPSTLEHAKQQVANLMQDPSKVRMLECMGINPWEVKPVGWTPPTEEECAALKAKLEARRLGISSDGSINNPPSEINRDGSINNPPPEQEPKPSPLLSEPQRIASGSTASTSASPLPAETQPASADRSTGKTGSSTPPALPELDQLEQRRESLASRAISVSTSLHELQKSQAVQGLNLRGDIVASQQRMQDSLYAAKAALREQDAAAVRECLDLAEIEVVNLEKFLRR